MQRIRAILERLTRKEGDKQHLDVLLNSLDKIRAGSSAIALCPTPTGSNWLGINRATKALFPTAVLELPQHYSNSQLSEKSLKRLAEAIALAKFDHVVFSGFPPYFELLATTLRLHSKTTLSCIFHGTLTELGREGHSPALLPFHLASVGTLDRVGLVRQDLAKPLSKLFAVPCFELRNICSLPESIKDVHTEDGKIHVGVFGNDSFNKNLHNQVAAALLIADSVVHVSDSAPFAYFNANNRIVSHGGRLSPATFFSLLGAMDINLYLSFSESFGQVVLESLAMGTPCLTSMTSNVLEGSSLLQKHLRVAEIDNPAAIAIAIEAVLRDKNILSKEGRLFVGKSNLQALELLRTFLTN